MRAHRPECGGRAKRLVAEGAALIVVDTVVVERAGDLDKYTMA